MIERKDHESRDLIAIRGTKLGRTQLTGTMSQELGSLFSVTWWEAFQWEGNHCHIDHYSSLDQSTGPWRI
jgi:hypothetical protein